MYGAPRVLAKTTRAEHLHSTARLLYLEEEHRTKNLPVGEPPPPPSPRSRTSALQARFPRVTESALAWPRPGYGAFGKGCLEVNCILLGFLSSAPQYLPRPRVGHSH